MPFGSDGGSAAATVPSAVHSRRSLHGPSHLSRGVLQVRPLVAGCVVLLAADCGDFQSLKPLPIWTVFVTLKLPQGIPQLRFTG